MSWDADLTCACGHHVGSWNYTHNTNAMIRQAAEATGWDMGGAPWFTFLATLDGVRSSIFLSDIADELNRYPQKYDALNPDNGWGSRRKVIPVLREMAAKASRGGRWETCG